MVLGASELRSGRTIELDGQIYTVVSYQHNKTGRGGAVIKVKIKNINTGATTEKLFRPGDKIEDIRIEVRKMQYLYQDADQFIFMDLETFDQINLSEDIVADDQYYLKENDELEIKMYADKVIGLQLPINVFLIVDYTEPGLKGDTVNNTLKLAKMDTGLEMQVPLFVNQGDKIRVDTRTKTYISREE